MPLATFEDGRPYLLSSALGLIVLAALLYGIVRTWNRAGLRAACAVMTVVFAALAPFVLCVGAIGVVALDCPPGGLECPL